MRRLLPAILGVVIAAAALYLLVLRERTVVADVQFPVPVAAIGVGEDAVGVAANGNVLEWLHPDAESLPLLPLSEPPKGGRLKGPALQQVRLLGAAPAGLRPYLAISSYDEETGIEIELRSGIELRFGDATAAEAKWRAVAAVLADPAITELDYVDVQAPRRPAVGGAGHALPAPP